MIICMPGQGGCEFVAKEWLCMGGGSNRDVGTIGLESEGASTLGRIYPHQARIRTRLGATGSIFQGACPELVGRTLRTAKAAPPLNMASLAPTLKSKSELCEAVSGKIYERLVWQRRSLGWATEHPVHRLVVDSHTMPRARRSTAELGGPSMCR